jgi:hypothetical protein
MIGNFFYILTMVIAITIAAIVDMVLSFSGKSKVDKYRKTKQ